MIIFTIKRFFVVKRIVKYLPYVLVATFGRKRVYSPTDIKRAMEKLNLDTHWLVYAVALYSNDKQWNKSSDDFGAFDVDAFDQAREYLAVRFFDGRLNYDQQDTFQLAEKLRKRLIMSNRNNSSIGSSSSSRF